MTPLDLRIRYKSETGEYPTYGKSGGPQFSGNYKGGLTQEYAEWLEAHNLFGDISTFSKDTGLQPVYYDNHRNFHYTKAYKEWLEECACKSIPIRDKWEKLAKEMETWD